MNPNQFDVSMFDVDVDSMAAPQSNYRYVAMPKDFDPNYAQPIYDDAETAYQNYAYDINYRPPKEKKSNYWRYQAYDDDNDGLETKKKYVKKERHPLGHKYLNYHPTSIRDQLNYLKQNHRNRFVDDNDDDDGDEESERIIDGRGIGKKRHKKKKVLLRKRPRIPYVPTSSYENDGRVPPYYVAAVPSHNHKNCDSNEHTNNQDLAANADDYYDDEEENYPVHTTAAPSKRKKARNKGLTFYITKVRDPSANTERMLRIDNGETNDGDDVGTRETAFVPTRFLASVRGTEKTVYKKKHRVSAKPRVKERLIESGGHVVYTEDGYEDKQYDHGSQEKYVHYHQRTKRETKSDEDEMLPEASELKGQELLDHIDGLLQNASDTITSVDGELQQRKRFPYYNSSKAVVKESPLRYAEHDEPFRANESNSYYDTKTKICDEIAEDVNVTTDEPDPAIPTRRLKNLGSRIDCVRAKLFGEEPLDNPIFNEEIVSEPSAEAVFGADSSVYSDVMNNIGHNKNQRVFSNYGISDNYDMNSGDTLTVKNRPINILNTNEKYPADDINTSIENLDTSASEGEEQTYSKNPFNNPAQVPILDISKFIPRPHPYLPAAPLFESDFVPVTASIAARTEPTTRKPLPKIQAVPVKIPVIIPAGSKPYYRTRRHPPRKNASNKKKRMPPNVIVLRRGQTMAIVRVPPPNKPR